MRTVRSSDRCHGGTVPERGARATTGPATWGSADRSPERLSLGPGGGTTPTSRERVTRPASTAADARVKLTAPREYAESGTPRHGGQALLVGRVRVPGPP